MLTLSNLLIELKDSKVFVRLSMVLHGLACLAFSLAHYHWIQCFLVIGMALWMMKKIMHTQKPYPNICALSFSSQVWLIILNDGECQIYQRLDLCLEAGFFTLLRLSTPSHRRYMVIFHDQLSHEALKMLYVIAGIRKNAS